MISVTKNKKLIVLGLASAVVVGCTATGGIDWTKIKQFGGTFLHAVALNYTGPAVASIDLLVSAFTGQQIQRPDQQQYPGQYQYGDDQYSQSQYPGSEYPGMQYPESQYPQQQSGYPEQQSGYPQQQSGYPEQQSGYPEQQQSWEPWGDPFPDPSQRAVVERNALSIDLALIRTYGNEYVAMPDGARLRDGVNRAEAGDRFGVMFATTEPAYVYIVSIDATGWAQTLFPYPDIPGFSNPVEPGKPVLLPNEQLYGLDEARGVETIFVLASRTPNYELENALEPLRGMERIASVASRGADERVSVPMVGQRGLVGIVPGVARAQGASLDRFFTAPGTGELAFSRWFIHE
jgi:hypothetical protein